MGEVDGDFIWGEGDFWREGRGYLVFKEKHQYKEGGGRFKRNLGNNLGRGKRGELKVAGSMGDNILSNFQRIFNQEIYGQCLCLHQFVSNH